MKFVLLLSMVAAIVVANKYTISINGTLTCHEPFVYNMKVYELDKYIHDFVAKSSSSKPEKVKQYRVDGEASDALQSEVEPLLIFWHTCGYGGKGGVCYCRDLGSISADFYLKLDIDFNAKDALKGFRMCKQPCINALGGDDSLYGAM